MHEDDYLTVLEAVRSLPFGVGKKLLISILRGDNHASIEKNNLQTNPHYASMAYSKGELRGLIDACREKNLLTYKSLSGGGAVLTVTKRGKKELQTPTHPIYTPKLPTHTASFTAEEEHIAKSMPSLQKYNPRQKKAIITPHSNVLCIAGAGTGKTTVLIARISFLVTCRGVNPKHILAITFTRKAKSELEERLSNQKIYGVNVHTFNGFAESELRRTQNNNVKLADYQDKARMFTKSLQDTGHTVETAADIYFSQTKNLAEQRQKLLQDTLSLLTFCKMKTLSLDELSPSDNKESLLVDIATAFQKHCAEQRKRLYIDQLLDIYDYYKRTKDVPQYDHVLVDEYQDVNQIQIDLLTHLNAKNSFYVGDPRQSIYGWRGSDIRHITELPNQEETEVVILKTNYRSKKKIVETGNKCIEPLLLPDLKAASSEKGTVEVKAFNNIHDEIDYVMEHLEGTVLIIARTNNDLDTFAKELNDNDIPYVRKDSRGKKKGKITLCTIHAAKGLEADTVFVVEANHSNHPIKVGEHPLIDSLQPDTYDREEEERRLFYVAVTRAKNTLHICYTGAPTSYIPYQAKKKETKHKGKSVDEALKLWRKGKSKQKRQPEHYVLPNSVLRTIAKEKPTARRNLKSIWGMTSKKVNMYGDEILSIIRDHV